MVRISERMQRGLIEADKVCNHIWFVSTLTSSVDLIAKRAFEKNPAAASDAPIYAAYIKNKDVRRSLVLLVPIFGSIAMEIYDIIQWARNKNKSPTPPTVKPTHVQPAVNITPFIDIKLTEEDIARISTRLFKDPDAYKDIDVKSALEKIKMVAKDKPIEFTDVDENLKSNHGLRFVLCQAVLRGEIIGFGYERHFNDRNEPSDWIIFSDKNAVAQGKRVHSKETLIQLDSALEDFKPPSWETFDEKDISHVKMMFSALQQMRLDWATLAIGRGEMDAPSWMPEPTEEVGFYGRFKEFFPSTKILDKLVQLNVIYAYRLSGNDFSGRGAFCEVKIHAADGEKREGFPARFEKIYLPWRTKEAIESETKWQQINAIALTDEDVTQSEQLPIKAILQQLNARQGPGEIKYLVSDEKLIASTQNALKFLKEKLYIYDFEEGKSAYIVFAKESDFNLYGEDLKKNQLELEKTKKYFRI